MDAIYIPGILSAPNQTKTLEFREYLPDLATLTPVQGQLKVSHHGNYLEVSAQVETIMTLTCDRCLKQYNHRLKARPQEMIWLETADVDALPLEREVSMEDLVESLHPQGYLEPSEWLYQQLCLAIPHRKLCDRACPGIAVAQDSTDTQPSVDRRWAGLAALKQNLAETLSDH